MVEPETVRIPGGRASDRATAPGFEEDIKCLNMTFRQQDLKKNRSLACNSIIANYNKQPLGDYTILRTTDAGFSVCE